MKANYRHDPELGTERFCSYCKEWWPADEEFWYVKRYRAGDTATANGQTYVRKTDGAIFQSRCKACWAERAAADYQQRKARKAA